MNNVQRNEMPNELRTSSAMAIMEFPLFNAFGIHIIKECGNGKRKKANLSYKD